MSAPSVLAIVPARGGSKGLPGKNLRLLAGHPLIAWSIAAGRQAASVDAVVVSTDDPEIASVAAEYGAEVPFLRPASLAQDDTPDRPVFVHALLHLERERGWRPDLVVQLRPTSPLRPRGMVDAAVEALRQKPEVDSLRTVAEASQTPYKMWRIENGRLQPLLGTIDQELYNAPRQRLPAAYWQTGQLDVIRRRTILAGASMTGSRVIPFPVDSRCAVDIDSAEQLALAERQLECHRAELVRPARHPPARDLSPSCDQA